MSKYSSVNFFFFFVFRSCHVILLFLFFLSLCVSSLTVCIFVSHVLHLFLFLFSISMVAHLTSLLSFSMSIHPSVRLSIQFLNDVFVYIFDFFFVFFSVGVGTRLLKDMNLKVVLTIYQ